MTSTPVSNELDSDAFTTSTEKCELTSIEYDSVDSLNKLPFESMPSVEYIADFDDSTDDYDENSYAMENEKLKTA